jgi:6,7-dimethyl-8-ribityllumazine synthase
MNQILTTTPTFDAPEQAGLHARRIAIVSASWHEDIVANAVAAARAELLRSSTTPPRVEHFQVPGAFEIPLHALSLAASGDYDAIIACGLVVNGGIYRHDFVAAAVINGLMQVQLQTAVPVFSAVLTPRDFHEHEEHQRFFREHFVKKGTEVARACVETLGSLARLRHSASARHRAPSL